MTIHSIFKVGDIFNAAQPGVGRVQVLGSKKLQTEEDELFLALISKLKNRIEISWGSKPGNPQTRGSPDGPRGPQTSLNYGFRDLCVPVHGIGRLAYSTN